MTEHLEPVDVRTVSHAHVRLVIEALLRYLNVEVVTDSTPEASVFLVRRIRARLGRPPKPVGRRA